MVPILLLLLHLFSATKFEFSTLKMRTEQKLGSDFWQLKDLQLMSSRGYLMLEFFQHLIMDDKILLLLFPLCEWILFHFVRSV